VSNSSDIRIKTLDGFRFISISLVVLFHYLTRWTQPWISDNYYPYGDRFADVPLIAFGGIGVHFFFMISGFVILFTLERTKTIKDFFIRRFIRLWPTMLLCSILTFLAVRLFDPEFRYQAFEVGLKNFFPGLTFTPTKLWNTRYMDTAYWSLEVEVKFYILAGISYFILQRSFVRAWTIATIALFLIYRFTPVGNSEGYQYLFFPTYLPFFSAGILFYSLFNGKDRTFSVVCLLVLFLLGLQTRAPLIDKICIGCFFVLFYLFVYKDSWLRWLHNPVLIAIGVASYPLYLFHQHAGVILIAKLAPLLPLQGGWQILYPLGMYGLMCGFSFLVYRYFELPVKHILVKTIKQLQRKDAQQADGTEPIAEPVLIGKTP
jgi:peptidoglycan/LPS O-acetylase OafA/YrhL